MGYYEARKCTGYQLLKAGLIKEHRREGIQFMKDIDFLELIFSYRSEMDSGGFQELLNEDAEYQKTLEAQKLIAKECEGIELTEEERKLVEWWSDEAHNGSIYARVAYRMGVMDGFLLLRQLNKEMK